METMVYVFRALSGEEESFVRDFEILSDQTFFDLHNAIQDELGYDKTQMASFFLTSDKWKKEREITLFDMREDLSVELLVMDKTIVGEIFTAPKGKMMYIFDFFSDRGLFMELVDIEEVDPDVSYPLCTRAEGRAPVQIVMEDNNIDDYILEEFEDLEELDDDLPFETMDDMEEF